MGATAGRRANPQGRNRRESGHRAPSFQSLIPCATGTEFCVRRDTTKLANKTCPELAARSESAVFCDRVSLLSASVLN
jgi:hypothetical protein